jgi:hypothetical protein
VVGGRAARGGRRRREKAARVGRRGGEDTADKWGPLDREMRERRPIWEGANEKGKCISREDATDVRAGWAGRDGFGLWDDAAGGLAGPEAERAARLAGLKARKKNFQIKIGFLNLPRL